MKFKSKKNKMVVRFEIEVERIAEFIQWNAMAINTFNGKHPEPDAEGRNVVELQQNLLRSIYTSTTFTRFEKFVLAASLPLEAEHILVDMLTIKEHNDYIRMADTIRTGIVKMQTPEVADGK